MGLVKNIMGAPWAIQNPSWFESPKGLFFLFYLFPQFPRGLSHCGLSSVAEAALRMNQAHVMSIWVHLTLTERGAELRFLERELTRFS